MLQSDSADKEQSSAATRRTAGGLVTLQLDTFELAGTSNGFERPGESSSVKPYDCSQSPLSSRIALRANKSWNPRKRSFYLIVLLILLGVCALMLLVLAAVLSFFQRK